MRIHEVAPPGREKQVKKLKKKFDDKSIAYAIAWAQHNKHGKPKKESQEDGPGDMGMTEDKGSTMASRVIRNYAREIGADSMDYGMFMKSADLLDKDMFKSLAQHIDNSDTAPREYVMKKIADHDPDTFKKMYGDQEGYLSIMKPQKDLTDAEDNTDRGMNKYGLAARNKDGKFYSYKQGKLTGTFNNIQDLQKHQQELIKDESVDPLRTDSGAKEELAKEIYYNNDEYQKMYPTWEDFMDSEDFEEENMRLWNKFGEGKVNERMPASIIKHKEKLAHMTDKELADRFKDFDETRLRQMAWRHGYGKMSSYYWDRVQAGKNESVTNEDQTTIDVKAILDRHGIKSTYDIEYGSDAFSDLFNYFSSDPDEMPYGVQKARTGMPDEWIANRLIDLGLLTEAPFQKKQAKPFSRTQKALNTLGSMFGSRKAQGRLNTGVEANKIAKSWAEYTSGSQATNINRELKGFIASVGKNASPETSAKWFQKNHNITIEPAEYNNTFKPDGTPQGSQTVFDLVKNNALDSKNIIEWFRKNHQMELTQNDVNQVLANSTTAITDFVQRKEAGQMGVKAPAPTDQTDTTQTTADQDAEKKQDPTLAQIKKLNPDATGKAVKALDKLKPGNLKPLTPPEEAELAPILNKIGSALADPSKRAKLVNMMTAGKYTDFIDFANIINESISREDLAKLDYLARQGLVPSNKVSRFKTAMRTISKGKDLSITYKDDVVDVVIKLASIITKPGVMQMVRRGLKKK